MERIREEPEDPYKAKYDKLNNGKKRLTRHYLAFLRDGKDKENGWDPHNKPGSKKNYWDKYGGVQEIWKRDSFYNVAKPCWELAIDLHKNETLLGREYDDINTSDLFEKNKNKNNNKKKGLVDRRTKTHPTKALETEDTVDVAEPEGVNDEAEEGKSTEETNSKAANPSEKNDGDEAVDVAETEGADDETEEGKSTDQMDRIASNPSEKNDGDEAVDVAETEGADDEAQEGKSTDQMDRIASNPSEKNDDDQADVNEAEFGDITFTQLHAFSSSMEKNESRGKILDKITTKVLNERCEVSAQIEIMEKQRAEEKERREAANEDFNFFEERIESLRQDLQDKNRIVDDQKRRIRELTNEKKKLEFNYSSELQSTVELRSQLDDKKQTIEEFEKKDKANSLKKSELEVSLKFSRAENDRYSKKVFDLEMTIKRMNEDKEKMSKKLKEYEKDNAELEQMTRYSLRKMETS